MKFIKQIVINVLYLYLNGKSVLQVYVPKPLEFAKKLP